MAADVPAKNTNKASPRRHQAGATGSSIAPSELNRLTFPRSREVRCQRVKRPPVDGFSPPYSISILRGRKTSTFFFARQIGLGDYTPPRFPGEESCSSFWKPDFHRKCCPHGLSRLVFFFLKHSPLGSVWFKVSYKHKSRGGLVFHRIRRLKRVP